MAAALAIEDVELGPSIFAEHDEHKGLFVDAHQIGNPRGAGDEFEIRLTKAVIREMRPTLKVDARVTLRSGDWLTVRLENEAAVAFALELLARAAEAHRPGPGAVTRRPPSGADLAKRRRFH